MSKFTIKSLVGQEIMVIDSGYDLNSFSCLELVEEKFDEDEVKRVYNVPGKPNPYRTDMELQDLLDNHDMGHIASCLEFNLDEESNIYTAYARQKFKDKFKEGCNRILIVSELPECIGATLKSLDELGVDQVIIDSMYLNEADEYWLNYCEQEDVELCINGYNNINPSRKYRIKRLKPYGEYEEVKDFFDLSYVEEFKQEDGDLEFTQFDELVNCTRMEAHQKFIINNLEKIRKLSNLRRLKVYDGFEIQDNSEYLKLLKEEIPDLVIEATMEPPHLQHELVDIPSIFSVRNEIYSYDTTNIKSGTVAVEVMRKLWMEIIINTPYKAKSARSY